MSSYPFCALTFFSFTWLPHRSMLQAVSPQSFPSWLSPLAHYPWHSPYHWITGQGFEAFSSFLLYGKVHRAKPVPCPISWCWLHDIILLFTKCFQIVSEVAKTSQRSLPFRELCCVSTPTLFLSISTYAGLARWPNKFISLSPPFRSCCSPCSQWLPCL